MQLNDCRFTLDPAALRGKEKNREYSCLPLLPLFLIADSRPAGILITRTEKGIQFADAAAITVNGKDKAVGLGPQTKVVPKAQRLKLGGTLLKDADSNVSATTMPTREQ